MPKASPYKERDHEKMLYAYISKYYPDAAVLSLRMEFGLTDKIKAGTLLKPAVLPHAPIWDPDKLPKVPEKYADLFFYARTMSRIDILIQGNDFTEIVEIETLSRSKDISKLILYTRLAKRDLIRTWIRDRTLRSVFVTPEHVDFIEKQCKREGFVYVIIPPEEW